MKKIALATLLWLLPVCCLAQTTDVSKSLETRTGHGLNLAKPGAASALPAGVTLADGLSEDEAVAIALWNNAALQSDLAQLGARLAGGLDRAR
jgi:hypothetical protein